MALIFLNVMMVVTVFIRRNVKQRWFSRRDDSRLEWAQELDACIKSRILPIRKPSRNSRVEMAAAEAVVLERWNNADASTRSFLYRLFRHWGLLGLRLQRLQDSDRWERARSALILGRIACLQAIPNIRHLLKRTGDVAFVQALEYIGDSSAIRPLLEVLIAENGKHRTQPVISALVRCARDRPQELAPFLKHSSTQLREAAAAVLAEVASGKEVEALIEAAEDTEAEVRSRVSRALGKTGELRAVPALQKLAEDPVWYVRLQAITALNSMRQVGVRQTYLRALEDRDWHVREKAALGLYQSTDNVAQLFATAAEIPHGYDVLISTLDRHGITWDSLSDLTSADHSLRSKSRAFTINLLQGGRFSCVLSGIEFHPQQQVRNELVRLVHENASAGIRWQCRQILELAKPYHGGPLVPGPRSAAKE